MSGDLRLTYEAVKGIFSIIPSPSKPDAASATAESTVDLEETARATKALIDDGVDAIMTTGTLGEGSTLTEEEWREINPVIVNAAEGRVPIIVGATTLNTRDTIKRATFARDIGAQGLFLGRPMWCEMSQEAIVEFYSEIAKAVPELGIIIYDNPSAFKGRIGTNTYEKLAEIPQVVGSKYTTFDWANYRATVKKVKGRIRMMPTDRDWFVAWSWFPEDTLACWSPSASCDPFPLVKLREAIFSKDIDRARDLSEQIASAYEGWYPRGDPHLFSIYNIPMAKIRFDAAGYIRAGPVRHPYGAIPEEIAGNARRVGERWKELARKLRMQENV